MSKHHGYHNVQERIFFETDQYFDAILAHIEKSQHSIDIETYIFSKDRLGERIAAALIQAAKRGVQVRILVDGAGSPLWGGSFVRQLELHGIETKIYHPFPWGLWQWSRSVTRVSWFVKGFYLLTKINKRIHRKIFIIDQKHMYTGSMNIDACHLKDGGNWRDTGIYVKRASVHYVLEAFNVIWNDRRQYFKTLNHVFSLKDRLDSGLHLNQSRLFRRRNYKNLLKKIARSKRYIWITNAYFVPDGFLLKKLIDAAQRGVDVRILLPRYSDVIVMPWASYLFYYRLLKAGVRIFEYKKSILHAKTLLIDDIGFVGTSNLNHRSLLHDLEIDVTVHSTEVNQQLNVQYLEDLSHAEELKIHSIHQHRNVLQRFIGTICLYLRYIF